MIARTAGLPIAQNTGKLSQIVSTSWPLYIYAYINSQKSGGPGPPWPPGSDAYALLPICIRNLVKCTHIRICSYEAIYVDCQKMNMQDWDMDMLYTCTSMYQQRYADVP